MPSPLLALSLVLCLCVSAGNALGQQTAPTGTPALGPPTRLLWPTGATQLPKCLMPAVANWDADPAPEVLCSDGVGRLWVLEVAYAPGAGRVSEMAPVTAGGVQVQTGGPAHANFVDFNGDGVRDLVIEDCAERSVRVYVNTGTDAAPSLQQFTLARRSAPTLGAAADQGDSVLRLPDQTSGKMAVADWDCDGDLDIISGQHTGALKVIFNKGSAQKPLFPEPPEKLHFEGSAAYHRPIDEPYAPYPTVMDMNGDNAPDLVYGVNWGYMVAYLGSTSDTQMQLRRMLRFCDETGAEWNQRATTTDYVMQDFGDFDGDGVLDVIFGGACSDLFISRGIPGPNQILQQVDETLAGGADAAAARLSGDPVACTRLVSQMVLLRQYALWTPDEMRPRFLQAFLDHCRRHLFLYGDHTISPDDFPGLPWAVMQARVAFRELAGEDPQLFAKVAEGLELAPLRASIFSDSHVVLGDNACLGQDQLQHVHDLLVAIPQTLHRLYSIGLHDLGPCPVEMVPAYDAWGCNVFGSDTKLHLKEDGFAEVSWPIPSFCACAAHEVNHTVDAYTFTLKPQLYRRKIELLDDAAPDVVVFKYPDVGPPGLDLAATKEQFRAKGLWHGDDAEWPDCWSSFWKTGPGAACNVNFLRGSLGFFIDAPQEAFATLSNQYFGSSDAMFRLAYMRWQKGIRQPMNQFLFFAEVYSQGTEQTRVCETSAEGTLRWQEARLSRNATGHIDGMQIDGAWHSFDVGEGGQVTAVR